MQWIAFALILNVTRQDIPNRKGHNYTLSPWHASEGRAVGLKRKQQLGTLHFELLHNGLRLRRTWRGWYLRVKEEQYISWVKLFWLERERCCTVSSIKPNLACYHHSPREKTPPTHVSALKSPTKSCRVVPQLIHRHQSLNEAKYQPTCL